MDNLVALPLLICGTLVVLVAVASISSYVLLRYADSVARKCPVCERKGGGEVVESELIESRTYLDSAGTQSLPRKFRDRARPIKVEESKYKVDYKCKYCEHEWTDFATDKEQVSSE